MIVFYTANGNLIKHVPEKVYQGSNKANSIYFICPVDKASIVNVSFNLPNGTRTRPYLLTRVPDDLALPDLKDKDGVQCYIWSCDIIAPITAYAGKVTMQFFITMGGKDETEVGTVATQLVEFDVLKGNAPIEPPQDGDSYGEVLAYIQTLIESVNYLEELNLESGSSVGGLQQKAFTYTNSDGEKVEVAPKTTGVGSFTIGPSETSGDFSATFGDGCVNQGKKCLVAGTGIQLIRQLYSNRPNSVAAFGQNNTVIDVIAAIVAGANNTLNAGANYGIVGGYKNTTNEQNNIIGGRGNTVTNESNLVVGMNNFVETSGAIVGGGGNILHGIYTGVFGNGNEDYGSRTVLGGWQNYNAGTSSVIFGRHNRNNPKTNKYSGSDTDDYIGGQKDRGQMSLLSGRDNINYCDWSGMIGKSCINEGSVTYKANTLFGYYLWQKPRAYGTSVVGAFNLPKDKLMFSVGNGKEVKKSTYTVETIVGLYYTDAEGFPVEITADNAEEVINNADITTLQVRQNAVEVYTDGTAKGYQKDGKTLAFETTNDGRIKGYGTPKAPEDLTPKGYIDKRLDVVTPETLAFLAEVADRFVENDDGIMQLFKDVDANTAANKEDAVAIQELDKKMTNEIAEFKTEVTDNIAKFEDDISQNVSDFKSTVNQNFNNLREQMILDFEDFKSEADSNYAASDHTHSQYALSSHSHSSYLQKTSICRVANSNFSSEGVTLYTDSKVLVVITLRYENNDNYYVASQSVYIDDNASVFGGDIWYNLKFQDYLVEVQYQHNNKMLYIFPSDSNSSDNTNPYITVATIPLHS